MNTNILQMKQGNKIHPHKFALWLGMGSISMMFAGLTSAYIVREAQGNWRYYSLPGVFWLSSIIILASSLTFVFAIKAFRNREMPRYRATITLTLILGLLFGVTQCAGFYQLFHHMQAVRINGQALNQYEPVRLNGNPSESFLYIIAGLHLLHLLGGIIALLIVFYRTARTKVRANSTTGLEIVANYWHFVDALWIYLFAFFLFNQ